MQYKKCECGDPTCDKMIPVINTKGKPARFATGHNFKGKNNPKWIGGEWINNKGYLMVPAPNHPRKDSHGYYPKHRLVMEQHLGRYLDPTEEVHHRDNNKLNNEISNLTLFDRSSHSKITASINPQCQKQDLSGRICLECGSDKTSISKNGQPHWMFHPISKKGYVCERCYRKIKYSIQTNVSYRRVDIESRFCSGCEKRNSMAKDGRLIWYKDGKGGWFCKNCYYKSRMK